MIPVYVDLKLIIVSVACASILGFLVGFSLLDLAGYKRARKIRHEIKNNEANQAMAQLIAQTINDADCGRIKELEPTIAVLALCQYERGKLEIRLTHAQERIKQLEKEIGE